MLEQLYSFYEYGTNRILSINRNGEETSYKEDIITHVNQIKIQMQKSYRSSVSYSTRK